MGVFGSAGRRVEDGVVACWYGSWFKARMETKTLEKLQHSRVGAGVVALDVEKREGAGW